MPMFEYSCNACGFRFEKLQKSAEAGQVDCPACGSADVKKELSTFSSSAGSSSGPCAPAPGGG
jgi:putative FmdB family regulatory protein